MSGKANASTTPFGLGGEEGNGAGIGGAVVADEEASSPKARARATRRARYAISRECDVTTRHCVMYERRWMRSSALTA